MVISFGCVPEHPRQSGGASMSIGSRKLVRLRAAGILLALLFSCLSAPITLALDSSNVCSMACCVKDGHCCCSPRRASVKGKSSAGLDQIASAEVSAPCPEGCATPPVSSNSSLRDTTRATTHHADRVSADIIHAYATVLATRTIASGPSSPRAPPSFLTGQTT